MNHIAIIISYCSNERHLIHATLTESLKVTPNVVVAVGTHFYNYEPEDRTHIEELAAQYPSVSFVWYPVRKDIEDIENPLQYRKDAYWHNIARIAGWSIAKNLAEWLVFMDADEVPDSHLLSQWLSSYQLDENVAYRLANYWYFKSPCNQAVTHEDSILLIHRKHCSYKMMMADTERDGMLINAGIPYLRNIKYNDTTPMFHHFSWVRSKSGILRKVANWGHKSDRNWEELIEAFWNQEQISDFVHNYEYVIVPNTFHIYC